MLVRYVCQRHERERRIHVGKLLAWGRDRTTESRRGVARGWKVEEKPAVAMFTGAVGGKLFRRWLLNGRRSFDELLAAPFHDPRIYWTHACSLFLSLSLSLFLSSSTIFVAPFSPFLSLFLSCSRLAVFYFYRQIRRKFIEHHFPRRFLQRKCNRAIKLCFSAARENSQPPKSRV